jgi:hypothetical protein
METDSRREGVIRGESQARVVLEAQTLAQARRSTHAISLVDMDAHAGMERANVPGRQIMCIAIGKNELRFDRGEKEIGGKRCYNGGFMGNE